HHGIALGFEILREDIIKVEYQTERLRREFELTTNPTKNKKLFLELARLKYEKWSYEEEVRLLIKLKDCVHESGQYFLDFSNGLSVKEIILGCKCENNDALKKIKTICKDQKIKIIAARQGWEDYKIREDGTKNNKM
ncbi:hypothetical protein LCGC14_2562460, partial [marine sediment metagenome]